MWTLHFVTIGFQLELLRTRLSPGTRRMELLQMHRSTLSRFVSDARHTDLSRIDNPPLPPPPPDPSSDIVWCAWVLALNFGCWTLQIGNRKFEIPMLIPWFSQRDLFISSQLGNS
jgi:hypothetical protein